jgi:WD40 repeat protein
MKHKKNKPGNQLGMTRENPYKGLYCYEERDKDLFQGRETEKKKLFRLVEYNILTVVFGKSGIGKTSLLNAGLFPKLRENGFLPIRLRPDYSSSAPGLREQVKNTIDDELKRHGIRAAGKEKEEAQPLGPEETLWEYFHRVDHDDGAGTGGITPVLVFDQFEEVFTIGKDHTEIDEFIDELYYLVEDQVPDAVNEQMLKEEREFPYTGTTLNVRVVISMREDYLPDLNSLKSRFPSIARVMFRVVRLTGKQAREIIGVPGGISDKNLIDNIVCVFHPEETDGKIPDERLEIEPSILSLLCFQLFERRDVILSKTDRDKILTGFYDSVLRKFPSNVHKFIEQKLLTEGGFRTPFYLESGFWLRDSIDKLINERIIRKVYYGGKEHVEIIHDVLTPIIKERRNRRVRKTKNIAIAALSLALAVFVFLSFYAFYQKSRVQKQLVRSLISEASLVLRTDNTKAIRIAEAAYNKKAFRRPPPTLLQVLIDAAASTYERPFYRANMLHDGNVNTIAFSPDETRILTASDDKTAKLWDLKGNGKIVLKQHTDAVKSAVFSPDGMRILTASDDKTAKLWNLEGKILAIYKHNSPVKSAVFSPDGTRMLTASDDHTARLWNLKGTLETMYKHPGPVYSAAFSPDGKKIVTASSNAVVKVWDVKGELLADLKEEHKKEEYKGAVLNAEFSPDGTRIVTASEDQTAKVWDWEKKNIIMELKGHAGHVRRAVFSRDGSRILTCSNDHTAKVWDQEGNIQADLQAHIGAVVMAVFSRDRRLALTCSEDHTAKVWDLKARLVEDYGKYKVAIKSKVSSPDGTKTVTVSGNFAQLKDAKGRLLAEYKHETPVRTAVFSPDGTRILTVSAYDAPPTVWDVKGNSLFEFKSHTGTASTAQFSPDGTRIIISSMEGTATSWYTPEAIIQWLKTADIAWFPEEEEREPGIR